MYKCTLLYNFNSRRILVMSRIVSSPGSAVLLNLNAQQTFELITRGLRLQAFATTAHGKPLACVEH